MPLGFEHGTVVPSSSKFDSQLTEEGDSQLSLYSSLVGLENVRAPSWSLLTADMAPFSSPLSSLLPSQSQNKPTSSNPDPTLPRYRPAAPLPFELAQHVLIYFEEGLHIQAFNLLTSLLSSGASSFDPLAPAIVPSPTFLALAATLSVHPRMTTRTLSREHHQQANAALHLLRLTSKVVGPINLNLASAFEFKHYDHKARRLQVQALESSQSEAQPEPAIDSIYADAGSLFSLAEDFWHVVGWAFNCSCLDSVHTARWSQWGLWLDFMIQVLESDWEIRFHDSTVEESLIMQFIESATSGYGRDRRIMRAIFADGSTKSLSEFRQVFKHELKPPKADSDRPKKREVDKLDIEAEIYGDWMVADDEDDSDDDYSQSNSRSSKKNRTRTRTPSTRRVTPRNSNQSLRDDADQPSTSSTSTLGGPKALNLRLRLLHLLSHVSGCPATISSFIEIPELYTLFVEFIRPLTISIFSQFVVILPRVFGRDAHCTLCEMILQRMLENVVDDERYLTRAKLINSYLPFAASKSDVISNAKVSILLESLLRSMKRSGLLADEPEVQEAVRIGVERRKKVLRSNRGRKGVEEELAGKMLLECGRRMLTSVGVEDVVVDEDDSDTIEVMPR